MNTPDPDATIRAHVDLLVDSVIPVTADEVLAAQRTRAPWHRAFTGEPVRTLIAGGICVAVVVALILGLLVAGTKPPSQPAVTTTSLPTSPLLESGRLSEYSIIAVGTGYLDGSVPGLRCCHALRSWLYEITAGDGHRWWPPQLGQAPTEGSPPVVPDVLATTGGWVVELVRAAGQSSGSSYAFQVGSDRAISLGSAEGGFAGAQAGTVWLETPTAEAPSCGGAGNCPNPGLVGCAVQLVTVTGLPIVPSRFLGQSCGVLGVTSAGLVQVKPGTTNDPALQVLDPTTGHVRLLGVPSSDERYALSHSAVLTAGETIAFPTGPCSSSCSIVVANASTGAFHTIVVRAPSQSRFFSSPHAMALNPDGAYLAAESWYQVPQKSGAPGIGAVEIVATASGRDIRVRRDVTFKSPGLAWSPDSAFVFADGASSVTALPTWSGTAPSTTIAVTTVEAPPWDGAAPPWLTSVSVTNGPPTAVLAGEGTITGSDYGAGGPAPGIFSPYEGVVRIIGSAGQRLETEAVGGVFGIEVPAGRYEVYVNGGSCSGSKSSSVRVGQTTTVPFACNFP